MEYQKTIANPVTLSGKGLFSGQKVSMTFLPAEPDTGIVFVRTDLDGAQVPVRIENVVQQDRRTALQHGKASIETTEHCLSALAGMQIDNIVIEMDATEVPAADGSAKPFLDVLEQAGEQTSEIPRRKLVVREPIAFNDGDACVAAVPSDEPYMQVTYELDYEQPDWSGRQLRHFDMSNGDYAHQIAPARTFVLESEARALRSNGLGRHLSFEEILVISREGPLGDNDFRFEDEPVRHKIVDLIGDLYLLGMPIQGRIIARKSGHALNQKLARELFKQYEAEHRKEQLTRSKALDIRRLARILPHRYPMLLVDRVIEIEGVQRAVGVKNVTINEPFFQGHYPGAPIMPGVLIVEAMAQLAGVLVGQKLENTGKLAVLLSLDKVKLRKPVTPGDQLILEAQTIRVRKQLAHMNCKAFVGSDLAAEAEIKFMLIDDEQA